jgi:hypothetical protein
MDESGSWQALLINDQITLHHIPYDNNFHSCWQETPKFYSFADVNSIHPITNSTKLSPSRETANRAAIQELPSIL